MAERLRDEPAVSRRLNPSARSTWGDPVRASDRGDGSGLALLDVMLVLAGAANAVALELRAALVGARSELGRDLDETRERRRALGQVALEPAQRPRGKNGAVGGCQAETNV